MALNGFTPNTKIESAKVNANFTNLSDHARWVVMEWIFGGTLTTGQISKDYKDLPDDITIERVDLICDTVPTGDAIIVDIERSTDGGANWTTIFTNQANRPQVAISARTGNTTVIDIPAGVGNSHRYRAVVDQIGSTIPGADLTITVKAKYDLD